MPSINLRLTEEEHAALKEWAHGSRRSMQREAVFRIFSGQVADEFKPIVVEVSEEMLAKIETSPSEPFTDPHTHDVTPDFKKGKK